MLYTYIYVVTHMQMGQDGPLPLQKQGLSFLFYPNSPGSLVPVSSALSSSPLLFLKVFVRQEGGVI